MDDPRPCGIQEPMHHEDWSPLGPFRTAAVGDSKHGQDVLVLRDDFVRLEGIAVLLNELRLQNETTKLLKTISAMFSLNLTYNCQMDVWICVNVLSLCPHSFYFFRG